MLPERQPDVVVCVRCPARALVPATIAHHLGEQDFGRLIRGLARIHAAPDVVGYLEMLALDHVQVLVLLDDVLGFGALAEVGRYLLAELRPGLVDENDLATDPVSQPELVEDVVIGHGDVRDGEVRLLDALADTLADDDAGPGNVVGSFQDDARLRSLFAVSRVVVRLEERAQAILEEHLEPRPEWHDHEAFDLPALLPYPQRLVDLVGIYAALTGHEARVHAAVPSANALNESVKLIIFAVWFVHHARPLAIPHCATNASV